jgi:CCR4-NOT transcription complex subunit 1
VRREAPPDFRFDQVIRGFDIHGIRVTPQQFLTIYTCFYPLGVNETLDIAALWGGLWRDSETQLSFISAFASLKPDQLDATTIPGLQVTFATEDFIEAAPAVQERAAYAAKCPLVSLAALQAMFQVALQDNPSSETIEAKRLFQQVVIPNLDIFLVSAAGVPRPWSELTLETVQDLFSRNISKEDEHHQFVLGALWAKDKMFVAQRLVDLHAKSPLQLPAILEQALEQNWLNELCGSLLNGFGLDLASLAHSKGKLDLENWAQGHGGRAQEFAQALLTFLNIKAQHELEYQRHGQLHSVVLPVKTISALLDILERVLPKAPSIQLILVQRSCITAYPRLINYGEGFDDIIDSNGTDANGEIVNSLPAESNTQMEMHYKSMYSNELEVRLVVQKLKDYKHSREPSDQDVFACMIHGLFDEYALYGTYPLDAFAITAVLFGGIISH